MSIYPVRVKEWFDGQNKKEIMKDILPYQYCEHCGNGDMEWDFAWAMHSAPYGGPSDAWCDKDCLNGNKKFEQSVCEICSKPTKDYRLINEKKTCPDCEMISIEAEWEKEGTIIKFDED